MPRAGLALEPAGFLSREEPAGNFEMGGVRTGIVKASKMLSRPTAV